MLADHQSAPISDRMKVTLTFLEKLTLEPERVGPADHEEIRTAGVSDEALRDATYVCSMFNLIDRIADAFDFAIPDEAAFDASAKTLLKRGYA